MARLDPLFCPVASERFVGVGREGFLVSWTDVCQRGGVVESRDLSQDPSPYTHVHRLVKDVWTLRRPWSSRSGSDEPRPRGRTSVPSLSSSFSGFHWVDVHRNDPDRV